MRTLQILIPLLVVTQLSACAHSMIPGTQVPDTSDNRAIMTVLHKLEIALRDRSVKGILALVSHSYFEDMGTPTPDDDYGYKKLKNEVLPQSMAATKEFFLQMEVQEIDVKDDHAYADVRYHSRARISLPSGDKWDSHKEFNRITLVNKNGHWLITSGL